MNHAITIGDLVTVGIIALGVLSIIGLGIFVIVITNPFRSGH